MHSRRPFTLPKAVIRLPEAVNSLSEVVNSLPEVVNSLSEVVNSLSEAVNSLPKVVNSLLEAVNGLRLVVALPCMVAMLPRNEPQLNDYDLVKDPSTHQSASGPPRVRILDAWAAPT